MWHYALILDNSYPKGQLYEIALSRQLSHHRVVLQCLNSPGCRRSITKGEVWGQESPKGLPGLPSGPQCIQMGTAKADMVDTGRSVPPGCKVASFFIQNLFYTNQGGKKKGPYCLQKRYNKSNIWCRMELTIPVQTTYGISHKGKICL